MTSEKQVKYLELTEKIAQDFSKDPSTKVGALMIDKEDSRPISFGYNGMLRGLNDDKPERNERPEKYFWYEHAERNAIYNKAQDILEGAMMFSSQFPNMDSARAISSSGIKTLVIQKLPEKNDKNFNHLERVLSLFQETGVTLEVLNQPPKDVFSEEHQQRLFSKYQKFFNLAGYIGTVFSKDPDEKVGAVIVNAKTFSPIAWGYNGMPRGFNDYDPQKLQASEKEFWIEEAEKNAIFNAVRPFFKNSEAYSSFIPCVHCARALISVGITHIVTRPLDLEQSKDQRWIASFNQSFKLFEEAGVQLTFLESPKIKNQIPNKQKIK